MLHRENKLRTSEAVQKRFARAERSESTDWLDVATEVQKELLEEFHITPTDKMLHAYRVAANKHGISLYVKYNRAREGTLKVGKKAPDVPLVRVDGNPSIHTTWLLSNHPS